jgi:hypothetical protein
MNSRTKYDAAQGLVTGEIAFAQVTRFERYRLFSSTTTVVAWEAPCRAFGLLSLVAPAAARRQLIVQHPRERHHTEVFPKSRGAARRALGRAQLSRKSV